MTFEYLRDCTPVEQFIWTKAVALSYCEFEGVHKLTKHQLMELRSLCDHQLNELMTEDNND